MTLGKTKTKTKIKVQKEPSLLSKIILIYSEQAKRRKALRLLTKQAWSFDFLSLLLIRAGKLMGDGVQLEIKDTDGKSFILTYNKALQSQPANALNDDIFNHLDDDLAVEDFIRKHSTR